MSVLWPTLVKKKPVEKLTHIAYVYPTTDGYLQNSDATWSVCRDSSTADTVAISPSGLSKSYLSTGVSPYKLTRAYFTFPMDSFTDGVRRTVENAYVLLRNTSENTSNQYFIVQESIHGSTLTAGDWDSDVVGAISYPEQMPDQDTGVYVDKHDPFSAAWIRFNETGVNLVDYGIENNSEIKVVVKEYNKDYSNVAPVSNKSDGTVFMGYDVFSVLYNRNYPYGDPNRNKNLNGRPRLRVEYRKRPKWVDRTGPSYWEIDPYYSGTSWDGDDLLSDPTAYYSGLHILPVGTWVNGYRPVCVRFEYEVYDNPYSPGINAQIGDRWPAYPNWATSLKSRVPATYAGPGMWRSTGYTSHSPNKYDGQWGGRENGFDDDEYIKANHLVWRDNEDGNPMADLGWLHSQADFDFGKPGYAQHRITKIEFLER